MHNPSGNGLYKALVWSLIVLFLAGCAGKVPAKTHKRSRTDPSTQERSVSDVQKDIIRPSQKASPLPTVQDDYRRKASTQLVEKGKNLINSQNYTGAEDVFQEAINIDSSNGIAYYYLSKARYLLGQYQQALGVLEKAQAILAGSQQWTEVIEELRNLIEEKLY